MDVHPPAEPEVLLPKNPEVLRMMEQQILQKFTEPDFAIINLATKRRVPLVHKETVIGRNPNLALNVNDISVSSKHAKIEMNDEFSKAYIVDSGAMNGTFVNRQRLEALAKKRLHHGDVLSFGKSEAKFKFVSSEQEKKEKECSDSDGEQADKRKNYNFMPKGPDLQRAATQFPAYGLRNELSMEDRLKRSEQQIQMLLGNNLMPPTNQSKADKEITIRQIVEDEKKLLESRFQKDLEQMEHQNKEKLSAVAVEGQNTKTLNQKLQRVVVEKENDLLKATSKVNELQDQLARQTQELNLTKTKLKALEQFSSELQRNYDKLVQSENEKTQALKELLNSDLTQKVVEYKNQLSELRATLKMKEKERQVYIDHLNLNSADPHYGAKILEQQSARLLDLQIANEELERRQAVCEKKWGELLDENQKNTEANAQLKTLLQQQRDSYAQLMAVTERRVVEANKQIASIYSLEYQDKEKKEAAEFLSAQVYQLYDERRTLVLENNELKQQNSEL